MKKAIIILSAIFALSAFGEKPELAAQNLDSLYAVWQDKSLPDSVRVVAFRDYIWDGFLYSYPDTAMILVDELYEFAKKKKYPRGQATGLRYKGIIYDRTGDYPKAVYYLNKGLSIFEQLGDQQGIAALLNSIGGTYVNQGEYAKAQDCFIRSLKTQEQLGDQQGIAGLRKNIGNSYYLQGDFSKALYHFNECLRIFEQLGDQKEALATTLIIGNVYKAQGDYPKAIDHYTQSLRTNEQLHDQQGILNSLHSIGNFYLSQGESLKALDYFSRSLKITEQLDDQKGVAITLGNIGHIYASHGDNQKALDYYIKSLNINKQLGDRRAEAKMRGNMGNVFRIQGDTAKALEYLTGSLKVFERLNDQNAIAVALLNIGIVYKMQDEISRAMDFYTRSLVIFEQMGDQMGTAVSHINIGNLFKERGEYSRALSHCKSGYDLTVSIGALIEQKSSCQCLYDTYKSLGKGNEALVYLEKMGEIDKLISKEETTKQLQQMEFRQVMLQDSIAKAEEARLVREAHQAEVRQKNKTRNIALGSGLFFVLLSGGFYSRWRYVRKSRDIISKERDRSDHLLLNILPAEIAAELKEKGRADARDFDQVSILFTDFKGFTEASAKLSAQELVAEINTCFEAFDGIVANYGIEKIKTIGDAYMAAGGLPVPTDDSVKNTVLAALEMQEFIAKRKAENETKGKPAFEMRVGIHTGPVVAGIVGVKKFQYDIWGDTVNTASRMESNGEVGKVNISENTYDKLKNNPDFAFEPRGMIEAKGKGEIDMYFVSKA